MGFNFKILMGSIFNFAFLITRDNALIDRLHQFAQVVELLQMHSFCLKAAVGWNAPIVETIAGALVGRTADPGVFYTCLAFAALQFALLAFILHQLSSTASSSLLTMLRALRLIMSLAATVLFFPVLEVLLEPFAELHAGHLQTAHFLILAPIGIVLFLIPVLIVTLLWFDPNPNVVQKSARLAPYTGMTTLVLKVAVAVATLFGILPSLLTVFFVNIIIGAYSIFQPCSHFLHEGQFLAFQAVSSIPCKS